MIQLATDPNASRSNWRHATAEAKEAPLVPARRRTGHAWPFLVRQGDRVMPQDQKRTPDTTNGS